MSPPPPSSSPPGVHVDKQTSLLLTPPRSTTQHQHGHGPRCHYQEEYLEEDIHTLLSDWMEHDTQGGGSVSDDDNDDASIAAFNDPSKTSTSPLSSSRKKKSSSNKNKKKWRRLQWRPPGMAKSSSKSKSSSSNNNNNTAIMMSTPKKKKNGSSYSPRLPPSSSTPRKHTPSSAASVTTFRSNASTVFTTKSTATQKHSNRASTTSAANNDKNINKGVRGRAYSPTQASILAGGGSAAATSIKSSTPPLARYRRGRRRAALNEALETSSILTDENSLLLGENENEDIVNVDVSRESDEQTHVTFEHMKIKVTKNYTDANHPNNAISGDSSSLVSLSPLDNKAISSCVPLDEAHHLIGTTWTAGSAILGEVGSACHDLASPTSVGLFPGTNAADLCGYSTPLFDECSHYDNGTTLTRLMSNGMKRLTTGNENDGVTDYCDRGSDVWDNIIKKSDDHGEEEETVATINSNERRPGPIDIDTCTRHLSPTERRHLRAMHHLGYTHLRANEYPQSIEIFTEILRGQKERHGKRSLQCAVAMHNLGVICMKCGRYNETVRLTDGAARIRVEKLGKDHLDVAVSMAQQGVALMELREFGVALASFREALRIRKRVIWGDESENESDATDYGTNRNHHHHHPLIIRLLNNIGCALFEMSNLAEARLTFENALRMQRELMHNKNNRSKKAASVEEGDDPFNVDPRDAYHTPLSIALTLTNLGSIYLRMEEFDRSLVYYEEAVLIQESVLGEDHKIVMNTIESIDFVIQSKEKQDERKSSNKTVDEGVKIGRLAGILPYVSYEESKRIYNKVQHEISAVVNAVSSKRCDQPTSFCADGDNSFTTD